MITGILLAAGRSQRMGQPKLLLPWHGVPLLRYVTQQALGSKLDQLIVVIGHRADHTRAALHDLPVTLVLNEEFLDGQSTSLRAGLTALDPQVRAVVVLLADQPLLRPATIDALIEAYHTEQPRIVVPRYQGQRGNPVLFDQSVFAELATIQGDRGAREIIAAHADHIRWLDTDDQGILLDLDTPEMYEHLATLDHVADPPPI